MKDQVHVVLYTKPGCHLCEEMKAEMAKANCPTLYRLEEINIEKDSDLLARYGSDIPVLLIDGAEAFRHRLTAEAFRTFVTNRVG